MTLVITKKGEGLTYHSLEDLIRLLKLAITSLDWSEINSQEMEEVRQLLESLRTVIAVRQERAEN